MASSISCVITQRKRSNYNEINTGYIFCVIISLSILLATTFCATADPTWSRSTRITAGQHKAIIRTTTTVPGTYTSNQTLFNALSGTPSVLLALSGYKQNAAPDTSTSLGFKITITSATATAFQASVQVFGATMYYYYLTYFAVVYNSILMPLNIQYVQKQFSASDNLMDSTAASRIYTQTRNYPSGQSYPLTGHTIVQQAYISGYKYLPKTNGNAIILNTNHANQNQYTLTIETKGNTVLSEVYFYRIGFDKTFIMDGNVNIIDELGTIEGLNSVQQPATHILTPTASFQYRNFIMGFYHIQVSGNAVNDFYLLLNGSPQVIYNSANYLRLVVRTFNLAVRTCAISTKYYHAVDYMCYDNCPNQYFNNNTRDHCQACHYSCKNCDGSSLATACNQCDSAQGRVYNSVDKTCLCQTVGRYQAGIVTCGTCAPRCHTCSGSGNNSCTGCTGIRSLANNQCICDPGYYDDGSVTGNCVPCSLAGCLECSFSGTESCLLCDTANKFEQNINSCICSQGLYLSTSEVCVSCDYRCQSCSDGSSCDSCSLSQHHRISPSTGTLCICQNGYFEVAAAQESVCYACVLPCITCSGLSTCLSCNSTTHEFDSINSKCKCKNGLSDIGNGNCGGQCGDGILTIGIGQQCDDKNTINQDGCSSTCKIEENHDCVEGVESYSVCYYAKQIGFTVQEVYKQPFQNSVKLIMGINAPGINKQLLANYLQANLDSTSSLKNIQLNQDFLDNWINTNQMETRLEHQEAQEQIVLNSRLLQISTSLQLSVQPTKIDRITYDSSKQLLTFHATYFADVSFQNAYLVFPSSSSTVNGFVKYFYSTPPTNATLQVPFNNIPTTFQEVGNYSSSQILYYMFLVLIILYLIFFVVAMAFRKTPIGIESLLVLQVSYFGLLGMNSIGIGFSGLAFWGKYSSGINFKIGQSITSCSKAHSIYFYCALSDNLNLMIYLQTLFLIVYIGILVYSNYQISKAQRQNLQIFSLKESLLQKNQIQKQELKMLNRNYVSQKKQTESQVKGEQRIQISQYNSQKVRKLNESIQPQNPNNMEQADQDQNNTKQYQFKNSAISQYLKKINVKALTDQEKQQMKNIKLFKYQQSIALGYIKTYSLQASYAILVMTTASLGVSVCFLSQQELGLSIFNLLLIVANLVFLIFLWIKIWRDQLIQKGDQIKQAIEEPSKNLQEFGQGKSVSSYLTKKQLKDRNYRWSGLQFSFKQIIKEKGSYLSFEFMYYPAITVALFISGIIAATVGSYLYYCPILVVCLVFPVLLIKFGVFQDRMHNFRAVFNLIAVFLICILELISNSANLGANIWMSALMLIILILVLGANIFCVVWMQVKNRQDKSDEQAMSSKQKKHNQKDEVSNIRTLINQSNFNNKNPGINLVNNTLSGMVNEQQWAQKIKSKAIQLKQIKKRIQLTQRTNINNKMSETRDNALEEQNNDHFEEYYGEI